MAHRQPFEYDIVKQGEETILRIDTEAYFNVPSVEDDEVCMARTIDILTEATNVTKIIFSQKREYEYDYAQTQMLIEIAKLYNQIVKQKLISYGMAEEATRYVQLQNLVFHMLRSDPIGAYVELHRLLRHERIKEREIGTESAGERKYISVVHFIVRSLERTKLITVAKPYLAGYKPGDRSVYRKIFNASTRPDFMFTKLMATYPAEADEVDSYTVDGTEVTIFSLPDNVLNLYHIIPPEFKLSEDKYEIIDLAREIMVEHKPKKSEFVEPERMRQVFYNVGHDLIEELADHKKIRLRSKEVDQLTKILVRYSVGFGLIELLLADDKVQDISINSPMGQLPIFIVHQDFGDCKTNIIPTVTEAESWASKLRMISGRPLDESNPILDTEITLPGAQSRVSTLCEPLSPKGLSFSFRRHRDKPWTLPLFIKNRMINPTAAGIISFLIDGTRTFFICGTRGSGKTSFLSACMVEIMRKYRIITLEDTLEIPFEAFKSLGYNFVQMKVASALARESTEFTATEGIRSTLRMGDSSLFVGEVRSKEAIALFEAMRVGAGSNVVGGTFHADTPYGVFDRCVNAIGIPRTSFKALDCCIIANPIRSADGLHMWRRILQITEVRKFWEQDPMTEGGFVDLMKYDSKTDQLEPSDDLINGESDLLKSIAGNVKEWAGNWDALWDNIQLRADTKKTLVDFAEKNNLPEILEADFVIASNDKFHNIADQITQEVGGLDNKRIFFEWNEWLKRKVKKLNMDRK